MNVDKLKSQWQKEDEFKIDSAVNTAIGSVEGRKLLWELLRIGRIGMQPYARNALDTAFACGELNVGQQILDRIISVSPEGYILMMKENESERQERDKLVNQADGAGTNDGEVDAES